MKVDITLEDHLITKSSISGFEKMVISDKIIKTDKRFEHVFQEVEKHKKIISSAREYLALYLQISKEFVPVHKGLLKKYPENKEIIQHLFEGLGSANGIYKTLGTRTTSVCFEENGKPFLAFGEMSNSDLLTKWDPIHSLNADYMKKFIKEARKNGRIIKEPKHDDRRRPYSVTFPSSSKYVSSDLFKVIFGADIAQEFVNTMKEGLNWGASIDFDVRMLKAYVSMEKEKPPYCYRNNIYFRDGNITLTQSPLGAIYKTVKNPVNFPSL